MSNAPGDAIRLLIVEDVPQVAQYIRNLLSSQSAVKLLDVVTDGTKAIRQIEQQRPDLVIVDALLQGRIKGLALVEQIRKEGFGIPVVVLTVPQQPVSEAADKGIHGVLSMPFTGYGLLNKINSVHRSFHVASDESTGRLVAIFAPKGGVGKTTIAFNLAVSIAQLDTRCVLIDGSLQFGDLRGLLKVPVDAPSLLDLPTDRIQESDLRDVLWRDPSGIDILLAPPRIEMAEMVTTRDLEKALSLLRRVYQVIVVDMPAALSDLSLAFLDSADTIIEIVTYESTTLRNTLAIAETFRAIGYASDKVQYLINRADSPGGMSPDDLRRTLGKAPTHSVVSDGMLVVQSNNEGVPFVLANPAAPISQDLARIAGAVTGRQPVQVAGRR
jgi:pilus assembly protein CpaE